MSETPTRENVMAARAAVLVARAAYRRGEMTLTEVYAVVDRYIALTQARATALGLMTRRPSRGYLIRAL